MLASFYRQSNSQNPPLRIGLLLDSNELPQCFAEVIDDIQQSNFARLEFLIFNAEDRSSASGCDMAIGHRGLEPEFLFVPSFFDTLVRCSMDPLV